MWKRTSMTLPAAILCWWFSDLSQPSVVLTVYDIEADHRRLRKIAELPPPERGPYFDHLRKTYPVRREFPNTTVETAGVSAALRERITGLGFRKDEG